MTETRTFYSKSKGLFICANHGEMKDVGGESKRLGEKHIQFREVGDFGMFSTNDPELIEFLERRAAHEGDVFGPEKYQKLIVPPEMQIDALERRLVDANRLIEELRRQGAAPTNEKKAA